MRGIINKTVKLKKLGEGKRITLKLLQEAIIFTQKILITKYYTKDGLKRYIVQRKKMVWGRYCSVVGILAEEIWT